VRNAYLGVRNAFLRFEERCPQMRNAFLRIEERFSQNEVRNAVLRSEERCPQRTLSRKVKNAVLRSEERCPQVRNAVLRSEEHCPQRTLSSEVRNAVLRNEERLTQMRNAVLRSESEERCPRMRNAVLRSEERRPQMRHAVLRVRNAVLRNEERCPQIDERCPQMRGTLSPEVIVRNAVLRTCRSIDFTSLKNFTSLILFTKTYLIDLNLELRILQSDIGTFRVARDGNNKVKHIKMSIYNVRVFHDYKSGSSLTKFYKLSLLALLGQVNIEHDFVTPRITRYFILKACMEPLYICGTVDEPVYRQRKQLVSARANAACESDISCKTHKDGPRVISYASRSITETEKRYSQTEKEALALVWAYEKFHPYVYGISFELITDHKPLEVIYGPRSKPCARFERAHYNDYNELLHFFKFPENIRALLRFFKFLAKRARADKQNALSSLISDQWLGPLPTGESILVVIDYYSRYYEVVIMKSTLTAKVIENLEEIFFRHGLPESLTSDNGPQFIFTEFSAYMDYQGIRHRRVTAKWPQANGEVERQNRSLLKRIQIAQTEKKDWKKELCKGRIILKGKRRTKTLLSSYARILLITKPKWRIEDTNPDQSNSSYSIPVHRNASFLQIVHRYCNHAMASTIIPWLPEVLYLSPYSRS
ncbi:Transposon Tf2-6 poly, partial [Paramuricea clavata]